MIRFGRGGPGRRPPRPAIRILPAAIAALLLVLAFPKTEWGGLVWFAPAIWFLTLLGSRRPLPVRSGLTFGLAFFGGLLYWTIPALRLYGGLNLWMSLAAFFLLVLYLSLYPVLFAVGATRVAGVHRGLAIAFLPVAWVALEWIRAHLFSGFPWGLLGYTLYRNPAFIQVAAWTGVYGVSFLVVAVNALVAGAVLDRGWRRTGWLGAAAAVVLIVPAWGAARLPPVTGGPLRVALVQGDIRQDRKWEPEDAESILAAYVALTRQGIGTGADLIVWPEAALPYALGPEPAGVPEPAAAVTGTDPMRRRLQDLVRGTGAGLLFGAIEYRRDPEGRRWATNSAQYLRPDGTWGRPYVKVQLVPFVETIPLPRILFFLNRLTQGAIADFLPGTGVVLHRAGGAEFATAICYEMIFPHRIREYVRAGASFLVNITNDGWFGETAGPYQHAAMSVFRAVENRRWVARAANTGISMLVDPWGRIVQATPLHLRTVLAGEIRPRSDTTMYQRIGDAFAGACGIMTLLLLLAVGFGRPDGPHPQRP